MAISNSFFGLRRGSTKSQTFSVLKGQQITKDRVSQVANPKTTAQMNQRALFATAVKFFKHANQKFFRFAFEDKKQRESEYNAFMRHNLVNSIVLAYDKSQNEAFPALGDNWVLTAGSLSSPVVLMQNSRVQLVSSSVTGSESNWGELCAKIIADYGLQAGDILTVVGVRSRIETIDDDPTVNPSWTILQWYLSPSSQEDIPEEITLANGFVNINAGTNENEACGGAVVFSRNIAGAGVKVSTSRLMNNAIAQALVYTSHTPEYHQTALNSWGATGNAILQGSIADNVPEVPKSIGVAVFGVGDDSQLVNYAGFSMPAGLQEGDYLTLNIKQGDASYNISAEIMDESGYVTPESFDPFNIGTMEIYYSSDTFNFSKSEGSFDVETTVTILKVVAGGKVLYP